MHVIHCRALADLPPCKLQAEDLREAADVVHTAVTGLKDLEQFDIDSIATSLAVSSLPSVLRTEWVTLTEKEKTVPPFNRLVDFMRQKASNITHVAKKGDPAPQSSQQKTASSGQTQGGCKRLSSPVSTK